MSRIIKALAEGRKSVEPANQKRNVYHLTARYKDKPNGWTYYLRGDDDSINYPKYVDHPDKANGRKISILGYINEVIDSVVFVSDEDDLAVQLEDTVWTDPEKMIFVCTPECRVFIIIGDAEYSYEFRASRLDANGRIIRDSDSDELSDKAFEIFIDELIDEGRDPYDEYKR